MCADGPHDPLTVSAGRGLAGTPDGDLYDVVVPAHPPRTYLHAGPPKTGTTYLQDVMWLNRSRLDQLGVTVPGRALVDHFHAALDLRGIRFGGYDEPRVAGAWRRLAKATIDTRTPSSVISHEIFGGADEQQISRVVQDLAPRELHLVFGARDIARQLPAVWQESLKNRRGRSFETFLAQAIRSHDRDSPSGGFWRGQDLVRTLRRWSAVVPGERIHVVTLPQPGAAPDTLWRRFATALGIDYGGFDLEVARSNAALPPVHAELLRRLNQTLPEDLPWPDYQRTVKRRFNQVANRTEGTPKTRVPTEHRDLLSKWAAETQADLSSDGYDIVGDLDDLLPAGAAFGAAAEVGADMVADAAVDMLAAALVDSASRRSVDSPGWAENLIGQIRKGRGKT